VTARRIGGLPSWVLPALGVLAIVAIALGGGEHYRLLVAAEAMLGLGAIVYLAWWADPAWTLSIGMALTAFSGNWGYLGVGVPFDRLLIAGGVVAAVVRSPGSRGRPSLRTRPAHWVLLAAGAAAFASALFAGTLTRSVPFYALVDQFGILPFIGFTIAPLVFHSARQRGILLGTLVTLGGYLGLTALFEAVGPRAFVFPRFILDPTIGIHAERARGPFLEAGANGLGLFFCGTAAVVAIAIWRRPPLRVAAGLVAVLCALGILFTLTRANWLAAPVAAITVALATPRLRRHAIPAAGAIAFVIVATLAMVPSLSERVHERSSTLLSVWDRENANSAALRMVDAKPLVGFGWGTFRDRALPYYQQSDSFPITGVGIPVHNVLLSYAAELGLIGATLWVAAFLLAVGGAITRRGPPELYPWRVGLAAVVINWLVVANLSPLTYALPNMLLWIWAGVVSAEYAAVRGGARSHAPVPAPAGSPIAIGTAPSHFTGAPAPASAGSAAL
jgi:putative inorganic carbon (hco3(-)) transporter